MGLPVLFLRKLQEADITYAPLEMEKIYKNVWNNEIIYNNCE